MSLLFEQKVWENFDEQQHGGQLKDQIEQPENNIYNLDNSGIQSVQYKQQLKKNLRQFIQKYINTTDKSMYFTIYEQINIQKLESITISRMLQKQGSRCQQLKQQIQNAMKILQFQSGLSESQLTSLQELMIDPMIALPQCKKSNQGEYCGTLLQVFLSTEHKNNQQNTLQFNQLQQKIQAQYEEYLLQFLKLKNLNNFQMKQKIVKLRLHPEQITSSIQQVNNLIIPGNCLHNAVLGLMALIQAYLQLIKIYISCCEQSEYQLVEIVLRWSIYRNFILSVQENLSFLLYHYNELFVDVFNLEVSNLQFSKVAINKWKIMMSSFHTNSDKTYLSMFHKIHYQDGSNGQEYQKKSINQLKQCLKDQPQQKQIIMAQYAEYMLDLSTNEDNVSWFGHSKQKLEKPFSNFQQKFITMTISSIIQKVNNQVQLNQELHKLEMNCIKPTTIRKIINEIQIRTGNNGNLNIKYCNKIQDQKIQQYNLKCFLKQNKFKHSSKTNDSIHNCHSDQFILQDCEEYISQGLCELSEEDFSMQIETQV